jgi:hypothetical protein
MFLVTKPDGPHCSNRYYQRWARTTVFLDTRRRERVLDARQYCCDWYDTKEVH